MSSPTTKELMESTGGAPLFFNKESTVGDTVTGTVVSSNPTQARDYSTGALKFWDDGKPQYQLSITLQTTLRTLERDDGLRRVFLKTWGEEYTRFRQAITKVGDSYLRDGSTLTVTFVGFGDQKDRNLNAPKMYEFTYHAPPSATQVLMTNGGTAQVPTTTTSPFIDAARVVQEEAAVRNATPTPAAPGVDARADLDKIKKLSTAGWSIQEIHEVMPHRNHEQIQAVLSI